MVFHNGFIIHRKNMEIWNIFYCLFFDKNVRFGVNSESTISRVVAICDFTESKSSFSI